MHWRVNAWLHYVTPSSTHSLVHKIEPAERGALVWSAWQHHFGGGGKFFDQHLKMMWNTAVSRNNFQNVHWQGASKHGFLGCEIKVQLSMQRLQKISASWAVSSVDLPSCFNHIIPAIPRTFCQRWMISGIMRVSLEWACIRNNWQQQFLCVLMCSFRHSRLLPDLNSFETGVWWEWGGMRILVSPYDRKLKMHIVFFHLKTQERTVLGSLFLFCSFPWVWLFLRACCEPHVFCDFSIVHGWENS